MKGEAVVRPNFYQKVNPPELLSPIMGNSSGRNKLDKEKVHYKHDIPSLVIFNRLLQPGVIDFLY